MQQKRGIAAVGGPDRVDRGALCRSGVGHRAAHGSRGYRPSRSSGIAWLAGTPSLPARLFSNPKLQQPATRLEFADVVAPARGHRREAGLVGAVALGEVFDDRAQAGRARRQRRQSAGARSCAQRPAVGEFQHRLATAQRHRQSGGDDLADRVAVVVGGPGQQFEQWRIERRRLVDHRDRGLQFRVRQVRRVASSDQHADHATTPERHPQPHARHERGGVRAEWRAVVEQPPERRVDGNREHCAQARRSLCEVVHTGCGQVCGRTARCGPKCRCRRRVFHSGQFFAA